MHIVLTMVYCSGRLVAELHLGGVAVLAVEVTLRDADQLLATGGGDGDFSPSHTLLAHFGLREHFEHETRRRIAFLLAPVSAGTVTHDEVGVLLFDVGGLRR